MFDDFFEENQKIYLLVYAKVHIGIILFGFVDIYI